MFTKQIRTIGLAFMMLFMVGCATSDSGDTTEDNTTTSVDLTHEGAFEMVYDIIKAPDGTTTLELKIDPAYTYDYTIDWGDTTIESEQTTGITHTYANTGTYTVKISGTFPAILQSQTSGIQLKKISHWGSIKWESMASAFNNAPQMDINATDTPDLSLVTNMSNMFAMDMALALISNINSWDVSKVTNMNYVFQYAQAFNQDISDWNISNVTTTLGMFSEAIVFNQDLSSWDTSKVTSMGTMFNNAKAFNQDIGNWNTSSVTNMANMFQGTTAFNQSLMNWNTSSATNMNSMFKNASALTGQDFSQWTVVNVANQHVDFDTGSGGGNTLPASW